MGGSKDEARTQVDAIAAIDPIQGHLARAVFNKNQGKPDLEESEYRHVLNAKASHIETYFEVADFSPAQNKTRSDMQTAIQTAATA